MRCCRPVSAGELFDVAIVGAGAAGLTAAIFASRTAAPARIVVLDGAPKIGAKILISGGGRCNVTHDVVEPGDFNGNRNSIARILRTFPIDATIRWFEEMGVALHREEGGKLFPDSNRARTVVDALLVAAAAVEMRTGVRVTAIRSGVPAFEIETSRGMVLARRVVLATGGRSVPKTGSDGSGYALARALGHSVTPLFPALVPLRLEEGHWIRDLSGTSVEATLTVHSSTGKVIERAAGSLLFTHFGISGPVALDISRHLIEARRDDPAASLVANFLPGETFETLDALLLAEAQKNPRATIASVLRGRMPERLLVAVSGEAIPLGRLTKEERRRVARAFVASLLPVSGDRGFDYAEVTAGGVPLSEIDPSTMASRRCAGLYLCGEILDVDGKIGGYNFQWAWASGHAAGEAIAARGH